MPLLLLQAESGGEIAFSRDAPGHIAALHLQPGQGIVVREHQFLAATGGVEYDYSRIQGFANMLYGGGLFVDQFLAGDQEGVVWVHGYGNVFEKQLEPGETIDIEPGGWVYRDHSVQMTQEVYGFKTELGTQLAFHQPRLRDEQEAVRFAQLAAQLGYLRLSGYRLVPLRAGLRSKINIVNPATGAIAVTIPDRHPGRLLGGGPNLLRLLEAVSSLPAAGPPADTGSPELLRQVLLALALRDESIGGAEAAALTDRAVELALADRTLDPPAALMAAKAEGR